MHGGRQRAMELNEALANAGSLGRFQVLVLFLLFLAGAFHGARMTFSYFIQFQPDHRCSLPGWPNDTYAAGDYHHQVAVNESIPPDDYCHVYNVTATFHYDHDHRPINANASDDLQSCEAWVYDKTFMRETPTSRFNLVCDREAVDSYVVMAVMAGSLVGAIFFGWISDRFGRRICFQFSLLLGVAAGVALTWAPDVIVFAVLASIAAGCTTGMFATALVTGMEITLPEDRKISVLGMLFFFPIGEIFLSATSFGYRNWRWMNLTITAPSLLMASYYWIVPESPRWLKVNKRYEQLEEILHRVAKFNKRDFPRGPNGEKEDLAALLESVHEEGYVRPTNVVRDSILNMFKTRVLCVRSLVTFLNWYVVNFVFYGFILNSANLGEGPLLNFLLGALVEFPAQFTSLLLVDRLGRKPVHCFYLALVALSSAVAIGITASVEGYHWLVLVFALIGKFGAAGLMGTSFLWMAEIFPTSVRGTAIGMMGVSSRLGATTVPYIVQMGNAATPFIAFCVTSSLAFLAVLTLPETAGRTLPATTREAQFFGRREEFPAPHIPPPLHDDKSNTTVQSQYGAIVS